MLDKIKHINPDQITQPNWPPEGWSEKETSRCIPGLIGAPNLEMPLCLLSKPLLNSEFPLSILFMMNYKIIQNAILGNCNLSRHFPDFLTG